MDWTAQIDAYCERLGPGVWAEPVNALTNLAFLAAAAWAWPRARGLPGGALLVALLALIGLGSGLFHTLATNWAALADVLPIVGFILVYLFLAARGILGLGRGGALAACLAFLAVQPALVPALARLPLVGASAPYLPVPLLILLFAALARRSAPATARRLAIGAGLLALSILLRSLDAPLCAGLPIGTHFLWHLMNAVMLAWMIETYRRHMLAGDGAAR